MKVQTAKIQIQVELGQVVMTCGVSALLDEHPLVGQLHARKLLERHRSGDWGDLDDEDKAANDRAVGTDDVEGTERILSAYQLYGEKVWIITEWDRSVTTILFPSEY